MTILTNIFILLMIFLILSSLAAGLYYLIRDQGKTKRTVRALTLRITLSLVLFIALFVAFAMGWLKPHSLFERRSDVTTSP
jgi:hypothetical protein